MKLLHTILLLLLLCTASLLQAQDCPPKEAMRMLNEAKTELSKGHYEKAINKCNSAATCDPTLTTQANALILKIYTDINAQKDSAEVRQKRAEEQTRKAQSLALTSAANLAIYKEEDYTKGFRYAQYAWEKDSNNVEAKIALYRTIYQPQKLTQPLYKSLILEDRADIALFSPDGKKIITSSFDTIIIWDSQNYNKLLTLKGTEGFINHITISSNSKTILAETKDSLKIWDFDSGEPLAVFRIPINLDYYLRISPLCKFSLDGKHVTIPSINGIKVWDIADKKVLYVLNTDGIKEMDKHDFSLDGKYLLAFSPHNILIWNFYNKSVVLNLAFQADTTIRSATFSTDSNRVIISINSGILAIWDIKTGKIIKSEDKAGYIRHLQTADNGKLIISRSDNNIILWDGLNLKKIKTITNISGNFVPKISPYSTKIAFPCLDSSIYIWDVTSKSGFSYFSQERFSDAFISPNSEKVITAPFDFPKTNNVIKIWNIENKYIINDSFCGEKKPFLMTISHDKKRIATYNLDNTLTIWDIQSKKLLSDFTIPYDKFSGINIDFSPDNNKVAISFNFGKIIVWDIQGDSLLLQLSGNAGAKWKTNFSIDSKNIIVISYNHDIEVCSIIDKKRILSLTGHTQTVNSSFFSQDDNFIISSSDDKTAKIWSISQKKCVDSIVIGTLWGLEAYFGNTNKQVITVADNGYVNYWNLQKTERIVLKENNTDIDFISFFVDKNKIAWASEDILTICDINNIKTKINFTGHKSSISELAFSQDNKYIASASTDNTVKIWDIKNNKLLIDCQIHNRNNIIQNVAYYANDKRILSCDGSTVWDWLIDIPKIVTELNNKIDDLSPSEKAKYGIN